MSCLHRLYLIIQGQKGDKQAFLNTVLYVILLVCYVFTSNSRPNRHNQLNIDHIDYGSSHCVKVNIITFFLTKTPIVFVFDKLARF